MNTFYLLTFFNNVQLQSLARHHLKDHGYLSPDRTEQGQRVSLPFESLMDF